MTANQKTYRWAGPCKLRNRAFRYFTPLCKAVLTKLGVMDVCICLTSNDTSGKGKSSSVWYNVYGDDATISFPDLLTLYSMDTHFDATTDSF